MAISNRSLQALGAQADEYLTGRPVVHGTQGVVSAGHYLTAMSAMKMLLSGGNAFDAAVAAGFAAAVVEPTAYYSLGSEGSFMLYRAEERDLKVLSGQGVAAGRATIDLFKERGLDKIPTGAGPYAELSLTVPGVVDAFLLMLGTYGTKTLGETLAPAIEYAQNGFPMYQSMRRELQQPGTIEQFRRYPPGGMEVFYPGGSSPEVGQLLVQKQLAATLNRLAQAEAGAAGGRMAGIEAAREMFYTGDIARIIIQGSDKVGGLLSLEDLAGYHARFEEPVKTSFMGYEICGQSSWTQGMVLLQALNILEHFDLAAMGHNSPRYIHTVAETLKLGFADRETYYGDPDFASVPIQGLLSKEYGAQRAKLVREAEAWPALPEAGDPWPYCEAKASPPAASATQSSPTTGGAGGQPQGGTTHFAVIDRDGNMVCATPSGGQLSKSIFIPDLGCALSTRSEMFFLDPNHSNGLYPGKRPRTTLVNYMVCKDSQPVMTIGCPGGDMQVQANLQLLLNVLVFGMDPQQAVEVPRFASESVTNSFYPRAYLPGQLDVEPGIPIEIRAKLEEMGHKVVEESPCGMGAIVTQRDLETGVMAAGADPRRTTYAIGW